MRGQLAVIYDVASKRLHCDAILQCFVGWLGSFYGEFILLEALHQEPINFVGEN